MSTPSTVFFRVLVLDYILDGITSARVVSWANFHRALVVLRSFIMARKSDGLILVPCEMPAGALINSEKQVESSLTR